MKRTLIIIALLGLTAGCASNESRDAGTRYIVPSSNTAALGRSDAQDVHAALEPHAPKGVNVDAVPRVLHSRFPDYPQRLRREGIQGKVVVDFIIEPSGDVSKPVIRGAVAPELSAIALEAIREWKFSPAMRGGIPVAVWAQQEFVFKLD